VEIKIQDDQIFGQMKIIVIKISIKLSLRENHLLI